LSQFKIAKAGNDRRGHNQHEKHPFRHYFLTKGEHFALGCARWFQARLPTTVFLSKRDFSSGYLLRRRLSPS